MVQLPIAEKKMETMRQEIFTRQYLQSRLGNVFSSIVPMKNLPFEIQKKHTEIYSLRFPQEKSASVIILYDNGIDPEPSFSGPVIGRIFLEKGVLKLTTWPLNDRKNCRNESLFSNVDSYNFQFFAKDLEKGNYSWVDFLEKRKKKIPPMVKLQILTKNQENLEFAFSLPLSNATICFPKDLGVL